MCYTNTFIIKAEDCKLDNSVIPSERNGEPTVASIEYALISSNPYAYTQEDVQFLTYLIKNQLEETNDTEAHREQFFAKPKPCFRASPLVKTYGWGIHYNDEGRIAVYDCSAEAYQQFLSSCSEKI